MKRLLFARLICLVFFMLASACYCSLLAEQGDDVASYDTSFSSDYAEPTFTENYSPEIITPQQKEGIGELAGDLVEGPMVLVRDIMSDACYILGFSLLLIGLFQYRRHRQNPSEVPIGTPLVTIIVGIILVLLPYTYNLVQLIDT